MNIVSQKGKESDWSKIRYASSLSFAKKLLQVSLHVALYLNNYPFVHIRARSINQHDEKCHRRVSWYYYEYLTFNWITSNSIETRGRWFDYDLEHRGHKSNNHFTSRTSNYLDRVCREGDRPCNVSLNSIIKCRTVSSINF